MAVAKAAKPSKQTQEPQTGTGDVLKRNKLEAISIAMKQIDKTYGQGSIMRLGESMTMKTVVPAISTGSLMLDIALGIGGFPKGRIIEVYGPEASGKTTLCLHAIAEAQKQGGTAAFIDAEHALDPARAESIGVNLDDLLISQPDSGEQALEITETLIRSGAVDIIVVDSVAALVPKAELEGEMGDAMMGMQARLMSQAMRKLAAAVSKSRTLLIFTNQLRMKIGVMFGNPETTTGGQALKFYASLRIDMRKIGNITEGDLVIGGRHRAKVVKNKMAPPFLIAEFDILNKGGISKTGSIIDAATEFGILEKAGSFFRYKGEVLAQGRESLRETLEKDEKLQHELEQKVREKISSKDEKKPSDTEAAPATT